MSGSIYLVRHGQTHLNAQNIMHGSGIDVPLNDKGLKQAKELAEKLKFEHFDICFCSPLERARMTAMQILLYHPATKVIYDKRLLEINKGLLEGEHVDSEKMLKNENQEILEKYKVESKSDFYLRVQSLMNEITNNYKDKNVLIVSHSGTTKMAMFYLDPPSESVDEAYYKVHIKNASFIKLPNMKPDHKAKLVYRSGGKYYNDNNDNNCIEEGEFKMKKGFYPGVFDILHTGHLLAIEEAKKHCDYLIVGLHCCPNYKDPIQSIYERYMQLRACKFVDDVIPYYDLNDCKNIIQSLDFDIYFLGEDHKGRPWENEDVVKAAGKEIFYLSRKHCFSSSYVKERVLEKEE